MNNNKILIDYEGISIKRDKVDFLKDITLTVQRGDFVYLVGKTGSGKSTFLKSLYADIDIHGQRALVTDFDLLKITNKEIPFLRRNLGIVFQDFQLLLDRDVDENLNFAMRATGWTNKKSMAMRRNYVLDLVEMTDKRHKMPAALSDGEKQRVAIARALINEPEIILADEPTGSLDPETSENIMKVLKEINQEGTAVLMATHNYTLFRKFPAKIMKCTDGRTFYADYDI